MQYDDEMILSKFAARILRVYRRIAMTYDIYTNIGERSAEYKCRLNVTVKLRVRLTSIGFRSAALHAEGAVGNNVALSLTPATILMPMCRSTT